MVDIRKRVGKKGASYQVRYLTNNNEKEYKYQAFSTKSAANEFIQNLGCKRNIGQHKTTIIEAVDIWINACKVIGRDDGSPVEPYTLQQYEKFADEIKSFDWRDNIQDLPKTEINRFKQNLIDRFTRDKARRVFNAFHSVSYELMAQGLLEYDICNGMKISISKRNKKKNYIPSKGDVKNILKTLDDLAKHKNQRSRKKWIKYRAYFYLSVFSGIRPNEIRAIQVKNIRDNSIIVSQKVDPLGYISLPKTHGSQREIYVANDVTYIVKEYIKKTELTPNQLVFGSENNTPLSSSNVWNRAWLPLCEATGLMQNEKTVKFRMYDLRHFFASLLIENDRDLKFIQTQMGHESIKITIDFYGHLLSKDPEKHSEKANSLIKDFL